MIPNSIKLSKDKKSIQIAYDKWKVFNSIINVTLERILHQLKTKKI